MQYETIEMKEKNIAGFAARTNNSAPDMGAVIGGLWQKFFTEGFASLPGKVSGKTMGVYTDYENDEHGDYTFMTACEVNGDVPEGYEVSVVPAGKYAKFTVRGNMMTVVGEFWQQLWQMPLERTYVCDYEEYQNSDPEDCEVHIYIGIK